MSEWTDAQLGRCVESLDAGVSVNAEDRPHRAGEIGVLKTSALSGYVFHPEQNKAVVQAERRLVAEPVLANSILVSRMNTPALVGESCYVGDAHEKLFLPDRIWQLKLRANVPTHVRWLSYVLQSHEYRHFVEVHATGTSGSMKNLPKSALLSLPVRYPDEPEQAKIATVLSTIDSAIEQTKAIVEKLKQVKQGLLHDLLTRGVDANGELRPSYDVAPELYQESPVGWIPKEWSIGSVGSEFEIQLGKMLDAEKNLGVYKPYLGNKAVQWGGIDIGAAQLVRMSRSDLMRFRLTKGDLLVCEGGEVGRAAMWEEELDECYYQKALHRLRPLRGYSPHLMLAFLRYWTSRDVLANYVSQTSIAHLTQEKLASVVLPVPAGDEQLAIVSKLIALDAKARSEDQRLAKLKATKMGLMDDLLTGRVRTTNLIVAGSATGTQVDADLLLSQLCKDLYEAEELAVSEYRRELFGDKFIPELVLMREGKIRVEIRKENVSHNTPHLHIKHSDKIDASISLLDFSTLAGQIDSKTLKFFLKKLKPLKANLLAIWNELNEKENSMGAEELISNLSL